MAEQDSPRPDPETYGDFLQAQNRAFRDALTAALGRRSPSLVPFGKVRRYLSAGEEGYVGQRMVPVAAIVGSEQKSEDFSRNFAPKRRIQPFRWMSIDAANRAGYVLPPVVLYELGGVYFVRDGNHRVSVARSTGIDMIEAEVLTLPSRIQLSPKMDAKEVMRLINASMGERFAAATGLPVGRKALTADSPEAWDGLLVDIERHRLFLGEGTELRAAASSWYETMFLPLVSAARRARLLKARGATRFYLLAAAWESDFEESSKSCLDPEDEASRFAESRPGFLARLNPFRKRRAGRSSP
jgi:hypothetical protein